MSLISTANLTILTEDYNLSRPRISRTTLIMVCHTDATDRYGLLINIIMDCLLIFTYNIINVRASSHAIFSAKIMEKGICSKSFRQNVSNGKC